eukprot:5830414-Prymnesium_polylepis.1
MACTGQLWECHGALITDASKSTAKPKVAIRALEVCAAICVLAAGDPAVSEPAGSKVDAACVRGGHAVDPRAACMAFGRK